MSIYPDGLDVASVRWTTPPLPGAALDPGGPTFDVNIRWTPTTPGTYPFGVEVTMNDGTVHTGAANVVAVPVPAPSLTLSNVAFTYEASSYPSNRVSFDITRAPGSDTTPSQVLESAEASADDTFQYSSGDVNGNRRLDDDEVWHYSGAVPWYDYEPGAHGRHHSERHDRGAAVRGRPGRHDADALTVPVGSLGKQPYGISRGCRHDVLRAARHAKISQGSNRCYVSAGLQGAGDH